MSTKLCNKCKVVKPLDDFYRRSRVKDGRQSICKDCSSKDHAKRYSSNPRMKEQYRLTRARNAQTLRSVVLEALSVGCADCGIDNPVVLDFDHLRDKSFTISQAVRMGVGVKRLREEIAKCEVVCSNCHRIRTADRNPKHWVHKP